MSARPAGSESFWLVAAALVVGDQLTKYVIGQFREPFELAGVSVGKVVNMAGVFGISVPNAVLIFVNILICLGLIFSLGAMVQRTPARLGLWLLLGGAVSNLFDRLTHGGVVDIISLFGSPRFNLADVMVILGALSLLRSTWWQRT